MRNMADNNAGNIGRKMKDTWIWIALALMATVVVGGCIGEKKTVDYVRTDFFRGNFSISGTPSLNQSVNLVFTVDPIDDLPNSTIKLFLPDAISLVSGSKEWSGNFKKGERVHLNTTLKVTMPGEWEVRAYVVENSVPSDYREYYIYFNTTEKSGKVSRYPTPKNVPGNLSEQDIINRTRQYPKTNKIDGMYKRTDFFRGNFSISGTPSLNQSVNLVFTVDPIEDMPNSTIKLFLPDAISVISGGNEWSGNFKKGEKVHLNTILNVIMPGEWEIRAYVAENAVPSDYREYYVYFNSTEKSGKVSRYPTSKNVPGNLSEQDIINRTRQYPKTDKIHRGRANNTNYSSFVNSKTATLSAMTITGRFQYEESSGVIKPIRYATVKLYEKGIIDTELGASNTDYNGDYSFSPNFSGNKTLYVKVWSETTAAKVTDGNLLNDPYWGKTNDQIVSSDDSGTWNFPWNNFSSNDSNWQAMDYVMDEYQWVSDRTGWTRDQILVKWPYGTWPAFNYLWDWIELPNKSIASWNRVSVLHEYGHAVMYSADGGFLPAGWGPDPHYINSVSSEGFAMKEGWAEFMEGAVDNNPDNTRDYNTCVNQTQNIETNDWWQGTDCNNDNGSVVEGSVASIFWDIFDSSDSYGLSLGFNNSLGSIWYIISNDHPSSINQFWDYWFQQYGYKREMNAIYWESHVNKNSPPNIPASLAQYKSDGLTAITIGGITGENTIVMKGNISDPNEDYVQLEVEIRPVGTSFSNTTTCVSGPAVVSGSNASATCSSLADGQYHWQARANDSYGAVGSWLSVGENPESSPDVIIDTTLSNWQYNRKLTINGTSAGLQTNYQMKLTVYNTSGNNTPGTVYLGGNAKSDFSDLRFTKSDGVTLLDYWIESYTPGVNATVWVEVDSIPASPNTANIYLYYGNSFTPSSSNIHNTFLFGDDFEDNSWTANNWNLFTGGYTLVSATQRDGSTGKVLKSNTSSSHTHIVANVAADNIVIEANVKPLYDAGGTINYGVTFRDSSNLNTINYFKLEYLNWGPAGHNLHYLGCGSETRLTGAGWTVNNWYILQAQISGSSLVMKLYDRNGNLMRTITKTTSCGLTNTWLGIYSGDGSGNTAYYDAFRVRKYASPEPAWGT